MSLDIHGHCDPRFARVRGAFAAHFERGEEVGAAVCVFLGDEPVVDLWAGQADARTGRAWQRDTPCLAYSCAKAVTALCALRLCAEGAADVEGLVSAWWPEFAVAGKEGTTTAHLLSHQAGLPAFSGAGRRQWRVYLRSTTSAGTPSNSLRPRSSGSS